MNKMKPCVKDIYIRALNGYPLDVSDGSVGCWASYNAYLLLQKCKYISLSYILIPD